MTTSALCSTDTQTERHATRAALSVDRTTRSSVFPVDQGRGSGGLPGYEGGGREQRFPVSIGLEQWEPRAARDFFWGGGRGRCCFVRDGLGSSQARCTSFAVDPRAVGSSRCWSLVRQQNTNVSSNLHRRRSMDLIKHHKVKHGPVTTRNSSCLWTRRGPRSSRRQNVSDNGTHPFPEQTTPRNGLNSMLSSVQLYVDISG